MWYFPLLQPYVDHVPVLADLSDLEEKIRWCRQNDDKCRQIGENAKIFYERYVARYVLMKKGRILFLSALHEYNYPRLLNMYVV
jgi:hypothetical protein